MTSRQKLIYENGSPALKKFMLSGEMPIGQRDRAALLDEVAMNSDLPVFNSVCATDEMIDATKKRMDEVFGKIRKTEAAILLKKSAPVRIVKPAPQPVHAKPTPRPAARPVAKVPAAPTAPAAPATRSASDLIGLPRAETYKLVRDAMNVQRGTSVRQEIHRIFNGMKSGEVRTMFYRKFKQILNINP